MPDNKSDILKVNEIFGDQYHHAGCGCAAAMASDGSVSYTLDGDASVILEMLSELAAYALVKASQDRKQMEQGLMQFFVRVAHASSLKFDMKTAKPDLEAGVVLDEENIEKMREVLKS